MFSRGAIGSLATKPIAHLSGAGMSKLCCVVKSVQNHRTVRLWKQRSARWLSKRLYAVLSCMLLTMTFHTTVIARDDLSTKSSTTQTLLNLLTDTERSWLRDHPVISVAHDPGWAPIEFTNERGEPSGMSMEYLRIVEQMLGVKFHHVKNLTWSEAYDRLKRHDIDMAACAAETLERTPFWAFTKPYLKIPIVIAARSEVTYIADMKELVGKTVAVVKGYAIDDWLTKDQPEIHLVRVSTVAEGLEALQRGDVFAYIDNLLIIGDYQAKMKVTSIKIAGQTPYVNAQCMAVRKDWVVLAGILDKALDLISEAERDDIYRKWLPVRYEHGFNHTMLWQVLAVCTVVFFGLMFWIRKQSKEINHRKAVEATLREKENELDRYFTNDIAERRRTEEMLRASEERLRSIIDAAPFGSHSFELDTHGRLILSGGNKSADKILAVDHSSMIGKPIEEALPALAKTSIPNIYKQVAATGESFESDQIDYEDGQERGSLEIHAYQTSSNRMTVFFRDVTERKRMEFNVARLSHQNALILSSASEGILGLDLQGTHTFVNPAASKMLGYDVEELLGRPSHNLWHHTKPDGSSYPQEECLIYSALRGEIVPRNSTEMFWRKDGTSFPVEYASTPIFEDGKPSGAVVVFSDITERKKAENALQESMRRLQTVVNGAPIVLYSFDRHGTFTLSEGKGLVGLGLKPGEIVGRTIIDVYGDQPEAMAALNRALSGETFTVELSFPAGGTFEVSHIAIHDVDGRYAGTIGVMVDITDSNRAKLEMEKSEAKFRAAFVNAPMGMSMIRPDGTYIDVNPALCRMFGYSREELLAGTINRITHPDDIERGNQWIRKMISGDRSQPEFEKRYIHKNGNIVWGLVRAEWIKEKDGGTQMSVVHVLDITERKRAEEALRESEAKYRNLVETIPDGFYRSTRQGRFIDVNPAMVTMLGYSSKEELMGVDIATTIYPRPEDRVISLPPPPEFTAETEVYQLRKKDGTLIWLEDRCRYLRGDDGSVLYHEGVCRDITDRVLAEEERRRSEERIRELNEELERRVSERTIQLEAANKELEAFAYSVSHDLRAPLRAINGYTRILQEDYQPILDSEGSRVCSIIGEETQRMGHLIDDLLSFSRLTRAHMALAEIDMTRQAASVFHELTSPEERNRIDFRLQPLSHSTGDPSLLQQVWTNLLSNAIKFSSRRERPVIEVSARESENEQVFCVADNGAGFDMQYAGKLFGVFQRLHSTKEFEGTGVGLAIVQRIIHRHGGRVWAEGQPDHGAAFFFSMPTKGR